MVEIRGPHRFVKWNYKIKEENLVVFNPVKELQIGKVNEVNGTAIKVELDPDIISLTKSYRGKVITIGQMASIVKIHFGRSILFASVSMLRMKNELISDGTTLTTDKDARILEAELIGQGKYDVSNHVLDFDRGVSKYPLPTQDVYLMTDDEMRLLYQGAENKAEKSENLLVIGKYSGTREDCRADINKLFGNHCAILGSTGTGKSGTISAIIHGIMEKHNQGIHPRIIMIDPHGEYKNNFNKFGVTYKAYGGDDQTSSVNLILPYWLMTSDEFRSLVIGKTEYEATSQNNIVYEALRYARLISKGIIERFDETVLGNSPFILKQDITEENILNFDRDKPIPFKISDFVFHVDKVQGRKPGKTDNLAASSGRDKIDEVLKKLRILQSNPQLRFIMEEYHEGKSLTLFQVINQLVGDSSGESKSLKVIDISGLPNETAGILTALISRLVFQFKLWQSVEDRKKDPILLVYEEAHRYVPNSGEAQYKEAQIAVRRIAKEGRKYGIGLMLVSQRPADLEKTVLSQCSSWIIMRLTNSTDQSYVSNFLPDNLSGLTKILPSLTRREAVFVGEASLIPSRIKIRELTKEELPDSSDIDFVSGWRNSLPSENDIKNTIENWIL